MSAHDYNPFSSLYYKANTGFPGHHSRDALLTSNLNISRSIIGSTFYQKIDYTLDVIYGSYILNDEEQLNLTKKRYGILDYLGFIVPHFICACLYRFCSFLARNNNIPFIFAIQIFMLLPLTLMNFVFTLINVVIRTMLTILLTAIATLVFIPVVHLFTSYIKSSIYKNIDDLVKNENFIQDTKTIFPNHDNNFSYTTKDGNTKSFYISENLFDHDNFKLLMHDNKNNTTFFKKYTKQELLESPLVKEIMRIA